MQVPVDDPPPADPTLHDVDVDAVAPLPDDQRAPSEAAEPDWAAPPSHVTTPSHAATGRFRVTHAPTSQYQALSSLFRQGRVFERLAEGLNGTIALPHDIDIALLECRTVNAYYDPTQARIIVCYELLTHFAELFRPISANEYELGSGVIGATLFVFFHELGHALIHTLELPATGREEDAVDELAALILIKGGDEGIGAAVAAAHALGLQAQQHAALGQTTPFWDEHALDEQRFYNVACLIYGSDPSRFASMVDTYLPAARAGRCPEEYARKVRAWDGLMKPHERLPGDQTATRAPVDESPSFPSPSPGEPPSGSLQSLDCEAVALHLGRLAAQDLEAQLASMPLQQQAQARTELELTLPQQVLLAAIKCEAEGTSTELRACYLRATGMAQVQACEQRVP